MRNIANLARAVARACRLRCRHGAEFIDPAALEAIVARQVEAANRQAGAGRWIVTHDDDGGVCKKDLGAVLTQLPQGPNGCAVTLLDSGPRITASGEPRDVLDGAVIAWREGELIRLKTIEIEPEDPSELDTVWDGGLAGLVQQGWIPLVLDREGFERLRNDLLEHGVPGSVENQRWIRLWCPSYDELLLRLELAESVRDGGLPEWQGPDEPPAPQVKCEVAWLRRGYRLVTCASLVSGGRYQLVAYRLGEMLVAIAEDLDGLGIKGAAPELHALRWVPGILTPRRYAELRQEVRQLEELCSAGNHFPYEVEWHEPCLEEIERYLVAGEEVMPPCAPFFFHPIGR